MFRTSLEADNETPVVIGNMVTGGLRELLIGATKGFLEIPSQAKLGGNNNFRYDITNGNDIIFSSEDRKEIAEYLDVKLPTINVAIKKGFNCKGFKIRQSVIAGEFKKRKIISVKNRGVYTVEKDGIECSCANIRDLAKIVHMEPARIAIVVNSGIRTKGYIITYRPLTSDEKSSLKKMMGFVDNRGKSAYKNKYTWKIHLDGDVKEFKSNSELASYTGYEVSTIPKRFDIDGTKEILGFKITRKTNKGA
jgi:hypothetical protein